MSETKKGQIDRITRYANLIQKQTGKAVRPYRADGYVNLLNKYGTSRDASEQYTFVSEGMVADDVLAMHYEGNGLFAKIIDTPAEEALKHGFTLKNVTDKSVVEFYESALGELDWDEVAINCLKWSRLFGGAIAVMLINDGRGLEEPLDWKNIRSIDDIRVYDRSVVQPDYDSMFSYDPIDPFRTRGSRLGMPEFYYVSSIYGSFTVHESRCLVFQNGVLPEKTSNSIYRLWGMPEYIRINKALRDAEISHGSAVKMLDRSVQAVYKMNGLSAELASDEGETRVLKRLQAIDMARGLMNSITIDGEGEDYDFRSFQFAGVSDVVNVTCNFLSALTSIPQTTLFGRSPAGMNATGDADLENYYNLVQRIQRRMLKSNLRYLLSVIFQAGVATGEIDEVPSINVEFNSLWQLTEVQQLDADLKKAQIQQAKMATASGYIADQVLSPREVRKSLVKSGDFDIDVAFDDDEDEENFQEMIDKLNENGGLAPDGGAASPDAAPAATKLPQDMTEEEVIQSSIAEAQGAHEPTTSPETEETNEDDILSYQNGNGGSVGVLVIKDGKILAGIRKNEDSAGLICGPGGHIEAGETPEMAAVRETYEEFGIFVNELIPIGQGKTEPETGLAPYLYICTDFDREPTTDEDEMTDASFLTLEEIKKLEGSLFAPFADSVEYLLYFLMELGDDTHVDAGSDKIEWITVHGTAVPLKGGVAIGGGKLKGKAFKQARSETNENKKAENGEKKTGSSNNKETESGSPLSGSAKKYLAGKSVDYKADFLNSVGCRFREIDTAIEEGRIDDLVDDKLYEISRERKAIAQKASDVSNVRKSVEKHSSEIGTNSFETQIAYDEEGNEIGRTTGSETEVGKAADDAFATLHNHPGDTDSCFSGTDVRNFAYGTENVMYLATATKLYSIQKCDDYDGYSARTVATHIDGLEMQARRGKMSRDELIAEVDLYLQLEAHKYGLVYKQKTIEMEDSKKHSDSSEKLLDNPENQATITVTENSDGAPKGNQNAAGHHKRQHLSDDDKAKYNKRIVGQTTSDGVTVRKFADHAFDRIAQRNLSPKRIESMLQSATITPDKKHPNRRCYDVTGSRLVLDHTDGTIVTIEWRKQNK